MLYLSSSDVPFELNFLLFTLRFFVLRWAVEPDCVDQRQRTVNVAAMSFFDDLIVEFFVVVGLVVDDVVVNLCNLFSADDFV